MPGAGVGGGIPLAVVGVSHHTAPVDVRERMAFDREEATQALDLLRGERGIQEAVLLSTCNRTELYLVPGADEREFRAAEEILARKARSRTEELERYLFRVRGDAVVHHLFEVTAGLDSLVLGEAEIQGQVREAFEIAGGVASNPPLVGPVLHRLFEMALSVGGRVRSETRLGEGAASVASVAVELARKIFGPLKGRRVLVLGAGSTAELTVKALLREGVRGGVVVNRTFERAEALARHLGGTAVPLEELPRALRETDILVASTAARGAVITRREMQEAFPNGVNRPFLIMDIAIPRDVDPSVGGLPNVFLYNVDDLCDIIDEHLQQRSGEVPLARRIITAQHDEFRRWYHARDAGPLIRSLRDRAEEVRREETARILRRMGHLAPDDQERLEAFTRRLVNKLLHDPTVLLRKGVGGEGEGENLAGTLRKMYGLDDHGERDQPDREDE
jgi:glutamyl-tRNA reductase